MFADCHIYSTSSYEYICINLSNKPDWFTNRFPTGKVPAIEQNGEKMVESEMICLFLDQMHPENSLFDVSGQETFDAAKAWCSKVSYLFINLFRDLWMLWLLNGQCALLFRVLVYVIVFLLQVANAYYLFTKYSIWCTLRDAVKKLFQMHHITFNCASLLSCDLAFGKVCSWS